MGFENFSIGVEKINNILKSLQNPWGVWAKNKKGVSGSNVDLLV